MLEWNHIVTVDWKITGLMSGTLNIRGQGRWIIFPLVSSKPPHGFLGYRPFEHKARSSRAHSHHSLILLPCSNLYKSYVRAIQTCKVSTIAIYFLWKAHQLCTIFTSGSCFRLKHYPACSEGHLSILRFTALRKDLPSHWISQKRSNLSDFNFVSLPCSSTRISLLLPMYIKTLDRPRDAISKWNP